MAQDDRLSEFLDRHESTKKDHQAIPLLKDTLFKNGPDPRGNIVCVNCFDVRVQPSRYFGLMEGEVNVLNNAGGRIDDDAIRSIIVLDSIATVGTVIIVHHSDCGLTHSTDEQIKEKLRKKAPEQKEQIGKMKFGEITDLRQSVVEDMQALTSSPYLKHLKVLGFVYDVTNGGMEEVKLN